MGRCDFSRVVGLFCLFSLILATSVGAQGLQQTPYSAANTVRGGPFAGGLDLVPSNPLGLPGSAGAPREPESLYVSDGMLRGILPLIPNLQFGYLYDFGNDRVNSGRFTADYLLPFTLNADSEVFGEAHTEFQDFWNTLRSAFTSGITNSAFNNRVDMSFGGGFRTFLNHGTLLGVNGFYDTSRLGGTWYSSGGLGFEMAALMGSDALDFNFNWYGQLFNSNVLINAFRYGPSNFDFQAGYSHELWNGGPDLRLSATGYKFDIGNSVYGWNGGAELWSRDAMFVLRYNVGHDQVNETYQTVGGFVNIGFQLENIFRGESPFTKPEPIFKSPRTLRYMLTRPVRRDWHQSTAIVVTRQGQGQEGCTGECCNLDRFLASIPMSGGDGEYGSGYVSFPPVPYTCLNPTKFIVVEFDYAFDVPPEGGTATWNVFVFNSTLTADNFFLAARGTAQSGHFSFKLTFGGPYNGQSAFTTTTTDPSQILFGVGASETTTLKISNVVIHFNQW
ncbi:MAG: hypothetical protein WBG50_26045 [Desulfomonilaceae bacterium]